MFNNKAQCYGQFNELKDWWPKLLSSVRRKWVERVRIY